MSRCIRGLYVLWLLIMSTNLVCFCIAGSSKGGALDSPPMDVSWKDWLLVEDTQPSSDSSSGLLVRRITPKSVFVAPSFSGCSEGYRQDSMGRCVKLVKVNQAAQLDFLLQKLNSMYANTNVNNNNHKDKYNSGPFHISLPLGTMDNKIPKQKEENSQTITTTTSEYPTTETLKNDTNIDLTTTPQITETKGHDTTMITTTLETTTYLNSNLDLPTTEKIFINPNITYHDIPNSNVKQQYMINYNYNSKRDSDNNNNSSEKQDLLNKKPFVIIVANSTFITDNTSLNTEVVEYDTTTKSLISDDIFDASISTTTAVSNSSGLGVTDLVTESDGFTTGITSTTSDEPSTISTTIETPLFEPLRCSSSSTCFTEHTTTIQNIEEIVEEEEEEVEEEEEEEEEDNEENTGKQDGNIDNNEELIINDHSNLGSFNKNAHENSRLPLLPNSGLLQAQQPIKSQIHEKLKCGYSYCEPTGTIEKYPVQTTTPRPVATAPSSYYIRFPIETLSLASSASATTSMNNGYQKTSYVRFPDHSSSSSSSFPSASYGTKVWNDDGVSSSSSSTMWYPPSWFPLIQPHRGWTQVTDNHRKQQQSHESLFPNKHYNSHPHSIPTWINTYSRRDIQRD